MLQYETERHAKLIFTKWLAATAKKTGQAPSDVDTKIFAEAAVRMAQDFSRIAERYAERVSGAKRNGIKKSIAFERVVDEWQTHALRHLRNSDRMRVLNRFRRYLYPHIASRPVDDVKTAELVPLFRAIEDAGFLPLAHLVLKETIRIFRFAIASGYALHNPALDVRGTLYRWKPKRRATILLPERIGELLRAIDGYHSVTTSKYMLRLLPLVFVRPGELRQAEWAEIDFRTSTWRIPARRMKARRPHIVPLSRQAKRILRELHRITGRGRYVFPSSRTEEGVISVHLCTTMLKSIGFGGEITMSGFRSMAATLLSEQGWNSDAIERQLSHLDPRPVRRSYNFAEYMQERRRMMQAWADYLDTLRRDITPRRVSRDTNVHELTPKPVYAIRREQRSGGAGCWHVNFRRKGKRYQRYFSDFKCGGRKKSFAAAKAWRDNRLWETPVFTLREVHERRSARNRSGVVGVHRLEPKPQPAGVWQASVTLPGGRTVCRDFSVRKFGEREAFKRAVAARAKLLERVPDAPYVRSATAERVARAAIASKPASA